MLKEDVTAKVNRILAISQEVEKYEQERIAAIREKILSRFAELKLEVATLLMEQDTVNQAGEAVKLTARGRHDPCVLPRAVPVVEAMAAMVLADCYLMNRSAQMGR